MTTAIDRFFVREATIVHPSIDGGYGDGQRYNYETPASTETEHCWLHQLSEAELQDSTRDAATSTHVTRWPAGTTIGVHDRVVIDGQTFEVDGPPAVPWSPEGGHHVRAALKYVDG